jgi:hypothetical protein
MIQSIPLKEPRSGLWSKISSFWIGLLNLQTLTPLNTLEGHLKKCFSGYERALTGVHQLWDRVGVEWGKISAEECRKWIESMPRRIQAVIKAKGGHTKY